MSENATANADMQRHWNEVAGPRWVARAGRQEARNIEVAGSVATRRHSQSPASGYSISAAAPARPRSRSPARWRPAAMSPASIFPNRCSGQARKNIDAAGLGNVSLILADAQVHRFAPHSFDLLISRFGVMFFSDPVAAFTNLYGGLRQGGRLCMAVWSTIDANTHWKIPYEIAVRHLGEPAPADPRDPGPMAFRDPDYLREFLGKAGFADVMVTPRPFTVIGDTAESEAEHSASFGPAWRLMEEKNALEAVRQAIVAETATALAPYMTPDGLRLPGTVLLVQARR